MKCKMRVAIASLLIGFVLLAAFVPTGLSLAQGDSKGMSRLSAVQSGTYGTSKWEISDEGVLTIKAGELADNSHVDKSPWYKHRSIIKSVVVEPGVKAAANSQGLFYGLNHATTIDVSGLDTSNTTNMGNMFAGCRALKSIDVSGFKTDNLTHVSRMFNTCISLSSIDVSSINVSKCTDLFAVFEDCHGLYSIKGLEKWNTSKVWRFNSLFRGTLVEDFDGIKNWDTSSLKNIDSIFYGNFRVKKIDLSKWNADKIEDIHYAFSGTRALTDLNISGWDITKVNRASYAFESSAIKDLDLSKWDTSNIPDNHLREGMYTNMFNLQVIRLNPKFHFTKSDGALTVPPINDTYTGKWQAVGAGTVDNPKGKVMTASELKSLYLDGNVGPLETYVWQKKDHTPATGQDVLFSIHLFKDGITSYATEEISKQVKPTLIGIDRNVIKPNGLLPNGYAYEFKNVNPGEYTLSFEYPTGYRYKGFYDTDALEYLDKGARITITENNNDFHTRFEKIPENPPTPPTPNPGTDPGTTVKATAILANGDKYTDVLTATVLANERRCPILLTGRDFISKETMDELNRRGIGDVVISGGEDSVSNKVVSQLNGFNVVRYSGSDRYETAKAIGNAVRKISNNNSGAILVDGTNFPDVITISSLATQRRVPILLTNPNSLNGVTENTLKEWNISQLTIGGLQSSVSAAAESKAKSIVSNVDRIGGSDRFATASLIGTEIRKNSTNKTDMILVDGTNFPDGITVNSLAAKFGCPIQLTYPNRLPKATENDIKAWGIDNILVAGGSSSVSENVFNNLRVKNKERVQGKTRYETAINISKKLDLNSLVE